MEIEQVRLRLRNGWVLTSHTSRMVGVFLGNVSWDEAQQYVLENSTSTKNMDSNIEKPRYYIGDIELVPNEAGVMANFYDIS